MSSCVYCWFVTLSIIAVVLAVFGGFWHTSYKRYSPDIKGDVLLVFAHPDDEAMFFSPLLVYLRRINVKVHFLCLSNGNFGGMGLTREKELVASAKYYGLSPSSVTTINDEERLPDGMNVQWDTAYVAQVIRHKIASSGEGAIKTVVTFDKNGVSSHPNHIAVHEGVKLLARQQSSAAQQGGQKPIVFVQLVTRTLAKKYIGPFALIPYFFGEGTVHPNSFKVGGSSSSSSARRGASLNDDDDDNANVVGSDGIVQDDEGYEVGIKNRRQQGGRGAVSALKKAVIGSNNKFTAGSYGLPFAIVVSPKRALSSLEGLKCHTSQLMWFRYLFVFFSTYGYVNEYELIE